MLDARIPSVLQQWLHRPLWGWGNLASSVIRATTPSNRRSVTACPDRLVPAARKVTAPPSVLHRMQRGWHFFLGLNHGNNFWRQPVKTGVSAIRKAAQIVGNDLPGRQDARQNLNHGAHGFRSLSRSRRRLAAGIRGVRLRVQAP